jgi:hypothetical protein
MPSNELLLICLSAFAVVFFLLAILAVVMRLIMAIFPEKVVFSDSVYIAAMASVVSTLYPGTKITKVEEIK